MIISEGELKTEVFCLRFKTPEIAKNWKDVVEKAKEEVKDLKPEEKTDEPKKEDTVKATTSTAAPKSMAEIAAAQKASSWECQGCFSRNDNAKIQCPACETAKPGCEDEVAKNKEAAKPVITMGANGGFKFGSGSVVAPVASTGGSSGGFTFGSPSTGKNR